MDQETILGLIAGAFTSLCGVPQALKIWNTKSAKDVSYKMFLSLSVGAALWILFGVLQEELAIIITNAVTLALNLTILALKWKFGNESHETSMLRQLL